MLETRVILVRHAPTRWNREGRFASRTDLDIEPSPDPDALADRVRGRAIDLVRTSPAARARQTEDLLRAAGAFGAAPLSVDENLRELDFGEFEGRTRAELHSNLDFERWLRAEHGRPGAPEGESWQHAATRATRALSAVPAGSTAVFVSHGYLLKILVATVVPSLPADWVLDTRLPNAGSIELLTAAAGWVLADTEAVAR